VLVVVVPVISALLLLTIAIIVVMIIRRRRSKTESEPESSNSSVPLQPIADNLQDITIEERLGGGNFGDVYRGTWQVTTVALKKLTHETGAIDNEIKVLKGLNHVNIVRYFGVHVSPANETYIVMEFMSLGSLNSFLQKKSSDEVKTIHLIDM
jgi:serine/threonine protein kinase